MWKQLIALVLLLASTAGATTYYVDPGTLSDAECDTANDANGTSTSTPWCNPPGTRTANDGAFWDDGTWGAVTTSAKIQCGDTIILKAGSTQTSTQGGAWLLGPDDVLTDPTYYVYTCSAASPITIKVSTDAEWSGSSGNFTLDGTSVTTSDGGRAGYSDHRTLIQASVPGLKLAGADATRRLVVRDSSDWGIIACCVSDQPPCNGGVTQLTDLRFDYLSVVNADAGINMGRVNNAQISNTTVSDVGWQGISLGMNAPSFFTDKIGLVDNEVSSFGGAAADDTGIFSVEGRTVWYVRNTVHGGASAVARSFNTGVQCNSIGCMGGDFVYRFRDNIIYDNGAHNWYVSGNDEIDSNRSRNYIMGMQVWNLRNLDTANAVGIDIYGGAVAEIWHATTYHNTQYSTLGEVGPGSTDYDSWKMFNSLLLKHSASYKLITDHPGSGTRVYSDNCLRSASADSESIGGTCGTFSSPTSPCNDGTNLLGRANCRGATSSDLPVTAVSTTSWAANDWTLVADATAIDAGRSYLLANGASSGNTITVKANGGTGDPRNYLIGPASYLDPAAADMQVQIEGACGVRTITAMDATTITFDGASCSWADNAMVHEPWNGTAPDMGALEYAACHGGR